MLNRLSTPGQVQDFLNKIPFNFEEKGETLKSPALTMKIRKAHCFEGALLGAYLLSMQGFTPYVLHLKAIAGDYDHVIAPFKVGKFWGALSKTNHAVLRYREPIYKNIRELAMSYFHEYFLSNGSNSGSNAGEKTLRQYSALLNLSTLKHDWINSKENLWYIDKKLDKIKHYDMVPKVYIKKLRKAEKIEIQAGKIVEYKRQ